MNEFASLGALKQSFKGGEVDFVETLSVNGVEFRQLRSTEYPVIDMLTKGYKALVIYSIRKNEENIKKAREHDLNEWIVFMWGFDKNLRMIPYDVRNMSKARVGGAGTIKEGFKEIDQDRIIPDIVKVMIIDLPSGGEIVGKVDTGASVCSLHAEDIQIDRGNQKVSFMCPELSDNRFTVPLADQQAIRVPSSEKTEYRPVVKLNIKIAGKMLKEIDVNLNDRSHMDQPFLIGQNALEAGNFIIDPNIIKENLDVDQLVTLLAEELRHEEVNGEQTVISEEAASQLFDLFEQSDITLSELVRVLKAEAINRFNDVEY